jgi:hypothetical protein
VRKDNRHQRCGLLPRRWLGRGNPLLSLASVLDISSCPWEASATDFPLRENRIIEGGA